MPLILPNDFVNGSLADAVPVEQNYELIQRYINNEVINRDGSVAMTAPLLLVGDPTQPDHASNKNYVDAILPVGIMLPWPAALAPAGKWHLCDGASLAQATYTVLYNLIGTKFGGGTGTFMLPNLVGRTIFGYDPSQVEFNVIGKKGGTFVVPVPAHVHAMPHTHPMPHTHEHPHTHTINHDHGNTGAAGAHSHLFNAINNATAFANTNIPRGGGGTATTFPTDIEANHVHDVPPFAGPSGGVSDGTSGQPSVASTSGASVPNTSSTGAAGAEMIPPYVTLSYIIRIA